MNRTSRRSSSRPLDRADARASAPPTWTGPAAATRRCGRRSRRLLRADVEAGSFLGAARAGRGPRPSTCRSAERPGTVIGPYKLLEQIGEGGMGTVWMAEQTEPVKRLVAAQAHQGRHGLQAGHRPLRGRAPGPGPDGPPQHRQGARRRARPTPAGRTSSWTWSRACRSPGTATSTT